MKPKTPYRCVALTAAGFVQQLAVSYITHGYWFYVTGVIPPRKDPTATDRKIIHQYGIEISKWARARRKRIGLANVHYLRHDRFFVLLASEGEHHFFTDESGFKDVRRDSIAFAGYSIGFKRDVNGSWHPSVRIHPNTYRDLKGHLLDSATKSSDEALKHELSMLPFEAYAPVRVQFFCLYRGINRLRAAAGLSLLPQGSVRTKRRIVSVFSERNQFRLKNSSA